MKIKTEKVIDASLADVWKAMDDPDNLTRWQPTLDSYQQKYGKPGQPDSVAELIYIENGRKVTITETVTERREPDFLAGTYESDWGKTLIVNHFEAIDDNKTRWVMYSNVAFRGIMKVMSLFIGGSLRKRTDRDMENFKKFVEESRGASS